MIDVPVSVAEPVVSRANNRLRLELIDASGRADAVGADTVAPVAVTARVAQRCGEAEAVAESGLDLVPFVFFVDTANSRGSVAHHRYDGHYGLITPA